MNFQFKPFVAQLPDPGAKFIDTFTLRWANVMFYAFPPFSIAWSSPGGVRRSDRKAIVESTYCSLSITSINIVYHSVSYSLIMIIICTH